MDNIYGDGGIERRQNERPPFLITPLLDPEGVLTAEHEDTITRTIDSRYDDIVNVYGEQEAQHVRDIITISLFASLHRRLDKARMARDQFIYAQAWATLTKEKCAPVRLSVEDLNALYSFIEENHTAMKTLSPGGESPYEELPADLRLYMELLNHIGSINSPADALSCLVAKPELPSVELGYVNQPFNWDGASNLDYAVHRAIEEKLPTAEFQPRKSRLKIARTERGRFVIVPSKRDEAIDSTSGIAVVARSTYIIDLAGSHHGDQIELQGELRKLVHQILAKQEKMGRSANQPGNKLYNEHTALLTEMAEILDWIVGRYQHERPEWLQPMTKAFYAARRNNPGSSYLE